MRPVKRFLRRLRAWVSRQDADERLQAEIEHHLAHQTAEFERAGLPRAEARRQALLKFGGVESTRERWREERGLPALDTLVRDTRHALRRLRMAPAFTTATVLVLALGIGATTAVFTLVAHAALRSNPRCRVARTWSLRRGALHLLAVRQQFLGHEHLGGWTRRARAE